MGSASSMLLLLSPVSILKVFSCSCPKEFHILTALISLGKGTTLFFLPLCHFYTASFSQSLPVLQFPFDINLCWSPPSFSLHTLHLLSSRWTRFLNTGLVQFQKTAKLVFRNCLIIKSIQFPPWCPSSMPMILQPCYFFGHKVNAFFRNTHIYSLILTYYTLWTANGSCFSTSNDNQPEGKCKQRGITSPALKQ